MDRSERSCKRSSRKTGSFDRKSKNATKAYLEEWLYYSAGNLKKKVKFNPRQFLEVQYNPPIHLIQVNKTKVYKPGQSTPNSNQMHPEQGQLLIGNY